MKKILILSIFFVTILLTTGMTAGVASAHWRSHFSFGVFLPPPPIVWAPPVVVSPGYPAYGYYNSGYRAWVPGYWESRWTPYGWTRVWVPGYWRYAP